jgi:tripartite-type tricarboxylate transporter receptor subunit TctC
MSLSICRTAVKVLSVVLLCVAAASAQAQTWPSRTIRLIVPFAPGGAIDVMARLLAARMQESLKSPVIVENKAGAGGNLGADYVAKQPADGYTILYNTNGQAISPATYKTLPFDPFRDFIPVTQLFASNLMLASSPKLNVKTLSELIAYAKANPGKLNYGSSGVGNPLHLTMELLKLRTGIEVQMVPYKGDGEITNALINGEVDIAVVPVVTAKEQVLAGSLRGLAVTANRRAIGLDVPTVSEQGVAGFDAGGWQGLFVPANTPEDVVKRIQTEAKKAFETPAMQDRVNTFALLNVFSTSEEFTAFYKADVENFRRIVREAKIPLQE